MTPPQAVLSPAGSESHFALDVSGPDGAALILEQLLIDTGRPLDRAQVRRVVREASTAFVGEPEHVWWRWIAESGANLGLKCKVVDCHPRELSELAQHGVALIAYLPGNRPWCAVTGAKGRRFRIAQVLDEGSHWGDRQQLLALLGNPTYHDTIRCVTVESAVVCAAASGPQEKGMAPFSRYWALLQPEKKDMYLLLTFAIIASLLMLAVPVAVESLVTTLTFSRLLQPIIVLSLLLFGFLAFSAAIRGLQTYVAEIIQCRLFARVSADLAYRLPRVNHERVHDGQYMPELVNRFFDVVTVQKVSAKLLLDALSLVLTVFVGMMVLAFYHPWLLGFDLVLLAMLGFIIFILGRGAVATSIKESKFKYKTAAWLEELARCPITFKLDGGAEFALERADHLTFEYLAARKKHFHVLLRQILFALGLQALASAVLLGIGGYLVMVGQLTLGQLVAAELIVMVIVGGFVKLGTHLESFYDLMASVDKLGALFDLPTEEQEGVLHQFAARPATIAVHDVDYTFPDGEFALKSFNLRIRAAERVALVGRGKSVLLDLLFDIRRPKHGHLTIDGMDPRDLRPDVLRGHVVLVRDLETFHGSVAENVHLARPEITASDVRAALEAVGLLDDVLRLKEGLETEMLSGGAPLTQRQLRRLMIARAIVSKPGLLMIDGTLDALPDAEAEELMRMLCDDRNPWTLLIATSRPGLRKLCNRTCQLQDEMPQRTFGLERKEEGGRA